MAKAVVIMLAALAMVVVVAKTSAGGAPEVHCDVRQLEVCAPAAINGSAPTASCCSNLHAQKPCFCRCRRNPPYRSYIHGPNADQMRASCGISRRLMCPAFIQFCY